MMLRWHFEGASVTVTTVANAGYQSVNRTEGGMAVSTQAGYTFAASASPRLVANFVPVWNITLSASPGPGASRDLSHFGAGRSFSDDGGAEERDLIPFKVEGAVRHPGRGRRPMTTDNPWQGRTIRRPW